MNCPNCGYELAASDKVCRKCGTPRPEIDERFKKLEDEYFRLKGQVQVGRITPEQFNAAIDTLAVIDSRGFRWTIGADSGKWYFYNGREWVQADPSVSGTGPTAWVTPSAADTGPLAQPPAITTPMGSAYPPQPQPTSAPYPVQAGQGMQPTSHINAGAGQVVACGKCGSSNSADRRFCTRCGTPLGQAPLPAVAPGYLMPPQPIGQPILQGQWQAPLPAPTYGVVAPAPVAARKSRRGACVGCCLGVLLLLVGVPVLGFFLISNGVISQTAILNAIGLGTGEINISNLSTDEQTVSLASIDAESGSVGYGTDKTLKRWEIRSYGSLQPGRYQLNIPGEEGGGTCTLKIESGDVYDIAIVRTDVVITREKEPAQSMSDLSLASSSLCRR